MSSITNSHSPDNFPAPPPPHHQQQQQHPIQHPFTQRLLESLSIYNSPNQAPHILNLSFTLLQESLRKGGGNGNGDVISSGGNVINQETKEPMMMMGNLLTGNGGNSLAQATATNSILEWSHGFGFVAYAILMGISLWNQDDLEVYQEELLDMRRRQQLEQQQQQQKSPHNEDAQSQSFSQQRSKINHCLLVLEECYEMGLHSIQQWLHNDPEYMNQEIVAHLHQLWHIVVERHREEHQMIEEALKEEKKNSHHAHHKKRVPIHKRQKKKSGSAAEQAAAQERKNVGNTPRATYTPSVMNLVSIPLDDSSQALAYIGFISHIDTKQGILSVELSPLEESSSKHALFADLSQEKRLKHIVLEEGDLVQCLVDWQFQRAYDLKVVGWNLEKEAESDESVRLKEEIQREAEQEGLDESELKAIHIKYLRSLFRVWVIDYHDSHRAPQSNSASPRTRRRKAPPHEAPSSQHSKRSPNQKNSNITNSAPNHAPFTTTSHYPKSNNKKPRKYPHHPTTSRAIQDTSKLSVVPSQQPALSPRSKFQKLRQKVEHAFVSDEGAIFSARSLAVSELSAAEEDERLPRLSESSLQSPLSERILSTEHENAEEQSSHHLYEQESEKLMENVDDTSFELTQEDTLDYSKEENSGDTLQTSHYNSPDWSSVEPNNKVTAAEDKKPKKKVTIQVSPRVHSHNGKPPTGNQKSPKHQSLSDVMNALHKLPDQTSKVKPREITTPTERILQSSVQNIRALLSNLDSSKSSERPTEDIVSESVRNIEKILRGFKHQFGTSNAPLFDSSDTGPQDDDEADFSPLDEEDIVEEDDSVKRSPPRQEHTSHTTHHPVSHVHVANSDSQKQKKKRSSPSRKPKSSSPPVAKKKQSDRPWRTRGKIRRKKKNAKLPSDGASKKKPAESNLLYTPYREKQKVTKQEDANKVRRNHRTSPLFKRKTAHRKGHAKNALPTLNRSPKSRKYTSLQAQRRASHPTKNGAHAGSERRRHSQSVLASRSKEHHSNRDQIIEHLETQVLQLRSVVKEQAEALMGLQDEMHHYESIVNTMRRARETMDFEMFDRVMRNLPHDSDQEMGNL